MDTDLSVVNNSTHSGAEENQADGTQKVEVHEEEEDKERKDENEDSDEDKDYDSRYATFWSKLIVSIALWQFTLLSTLAMMSFCLHELHLSHTFELHWPGI